MQIIDGTESPKLEILVWINMELLLNKKLNKNLEKNSIDQEEAIIFHKFGGSLGEDFPKTAHLLEISQKCLRSE